MSGAEHLGAADFKPAIIPIAGYQLHAGVPRLLDRQIAIDRERGNGFQLLCVVAQGISKKGLSVIKR